MLIICLVPIPPRGVPVSWCWPVPPVPPLASCWSLSTNWMRGLLSVLNSRLSKALKWYDMGSLILKCCQKALFSILFKSICQCKAHRRVEYILLCHKWHLLLTSIPKIYDLGYLMWSVLLHPKNYHYSKVSVNANLMWSVFMLQESGVKLQDRQHVNKALFVLVWLLTTLLIPEEAEACWPWHLSPCFH